MEKALGFVKMASLWGDSDRTILIPEPYDKRVYDVHIDSYRHRAFNYFTDIIFTNLMEDLDNIHASYHNLHSMHEGM